MFFLIFLIAPLCIFSISSSSSRMRALGNLGVKFNRGEVLLLSPPRSSAAFRMYPPVTDGPKKKQ